VGDELTTTGFSPEDLLMDVLGAGTAVLVAATRTNDLVGFRTSHFGSYNNDVYSMDLNLAGLARRAGLDIGPLRFRVLLDDGRAHACVALRSVAASPPRGGA
jgi:hypothetical protein